MNYFSSTEWTYTGLSVEARAVVGSVVDMLTRCAAAPFVKVALPLVAAFGTFTPTQDSQRRIGATYLHENRTLIFNRHYMPTGEALSRPALGTLVLMAHQLVHAADLAAGRLVTRLDVPASTLKTSPTLVHVEYESDPSTGEQMAKVDYGPVALEAFSAYVRDPVLWTDLRQSMGDLHDFVAMLVNRKYAVGDLDREATKQLADFASEYLTPKLMELYLTAPEHLSNLPQAYAHAEMLAHAGSLEEIATVLGGSSNVTVHTGAAG